MYRRLLIACIDFAILNGVAISPNQLVRSVTGAMFIEPFANHREKIFLATHQGPAIPIPFRFPSESSSESLVRILDTQTILSTSLGLSPKI